MSTFKIILLVAVNYLKNIRRVSVSSAVVAGGLLATSIATDTHSV